MKLEDLYEAEILSSKFTFTTAPLAVLGIDLLIGKDVIRKISRRGQKVEQYKLIKKLFQVKMV